MKAPSDESALLREKRGLEQNLLAIGMKVKKAGALLSFLPLDIFSDDARETAAYVQAHPGVSPNEQQYATMIALLFEEQYQLTSEEELVYQAKQLMSRLVNAYAKYMKQTLITEMEKNDDTTEATLLRAVKQLDVLVVQVTKHTV